MQQPSSSKDSCTPATPYEAPRITELGSLHEVTLTKYRLSADGQSFTGPRIVHSSP
jgi:hypothetical protein